MGLKASKVNKTNKYKVGSHDIISKKKKRWFFRDDKLGQKSASEFPFGHFDVQLSEDEDKENLRTHFKKCKKNRGHLNFIPVEKFNLQHLPKYYSDQDLLDLIKAIADLTVKIGVRMTSRERPDTWPVVEEVPYPFSTMKGTSDLRLGSGIITYVHRVCAEDYKQLKGSVLNKNFTQCCCRKCQQSETPSEVWFNIRVQTATHLVFDKSEASHASITLFYDTEDSDLVLLDSVEMYHSDLERDHCELRCVTCDQNLAERLKRLVDHENSVWTKVRDKYTSDERLKYLDTPSIVVSHPHGCSKMISVGQCVGKHEVVDEEMHMLYYKYTYTSSTCPGSSGAPVVCLKYDWGLNMSVVAHSGTLVSGLNYSAVSSY